MELRHLRYFIAVAENQSFRVAAERIHITQPAITRQIQYLEAEIGVALFQRTPAGAVLTPAGELFLREVRTVLSALRAATLSARRVAGGLAGNLRIGFVENSGWDGLVPDMFARYQAQASDVHLELLPQGSPEQIESIMADRVDGGFLYTFEALPAGIVSIALVSFSVILAVPGRWQWPDGKAVRAGELNGTPLISFPRNTYPAYHDYLVQACARAGLTLNVVQEVSTEASILSLVAAGIGAAIVNAANRSRQPARVQFLELPDLEMEIPLVFAYRADNRNPTLARFIEMLKSLHAGVPA
ncbi:LysR family transcriptional regulator [Burkholderia perseverans]|uniref:LysR family transcriptional regulator n=1 Tax=Burkholderia perseverans TaxID=2615214 RepID=UPI001FEE0218|nr:LysR family transcriptional regulator [Burkholderia perseverans]